LVTGADPIRVGLKVWSTNLFFIDPALELYRRKVFDYIELYVVPGSAEQCLGPWHQTGIPFCLHAPHAYSEFNFSLQYHEEKNRRLLDEVQIFFDALQPNCIIFHPGIEGTAEETIRQIGIFRKEYIGVFRRALLENKPRVGINGETCIGASPEEVSLLLRETGLQFCLDLGHAIAYSAWARLQPEDVIDAFLDLCPIVFHLSDGDIHSMTDQHMNLGRGNYNIGGLLKKIPPGSCLSLETEKSPQLNLRDFEEDVQYTKERLP
jgi:deoxyribonuclease IV